MDKQRFEQIFETTDSKWEGDNAFKGLVIIAKYINPDENDILGAAEHDEIYSVEIDKLIEAGITEEDATALAKLNWGIDHEFDCLQCFV